MHEKNSCRSCACVGRSVDSVPPRGHPPRSAYNLEIRLILRKRNDAAPNYFMVIYNEDAEHTALHRGNLMRVELVPYRDNGLIGESNGTTEPQ